MTARTTLLWALFVVVPFVALAWAAVAMVGAWTFVKFLFGVFCLACVLCAGPIMCELSRRP